jgi:hypothetical protein
MSLKHEIRQSSVIQGTGPGAMTVLQQGVTVIVPGIDAWYRKASGQQEIPVDCRVEDVNLAAALHVDYFAVPPANGFSTEPQTNYLNSYIFPRWVVCSNCKSLKLLKSAAVDLETCSQCESAKIKWAKNVQVNFVMACEVGHLDEFPWVKWVHKGKEANCPNPETLSKLLEQQTGNVYIFLHVDPFNLTKYSIGCVYLQEIILANKKIKGVFVAHDHDYNEVFNINGLLVIYSGRIGGLWGVNETIRYVRLDEDSLTTYTIQLESEEKSRIERYNLRGD